MFHLFKKKHIFNQAERNQIVAAIRNAEQTTSGEIRLFVERKCKYVDALDRAGEIFYSLKMDKTQLRNGVLIYLAVKDKQLAIFGDEGIYKKIKIEFWQNQINEMIVRIQNDATLVIGICNCIFEIGKVLEKEFPYNKAIDRNELPDEIVFGKEIHSEKK